MPVLGVYAPKGVLKNLGWILAIHPDEEAMKEPIKIVIIFLVAAMLSVSGCTGMGPRRLTRDRFDYTTTVSDSWKSQMLLNMVKTRYGDAPVFLDVDSVISQYEFEGSIDLIASWFSNPFSTSQEIGGHGKYADRPTITYSPLTGERFAKSLMTPIPPVSILNIVQSGYRVDLVFRLGVQSINGVQNRYSGAARARNADPEFYRLLDKLRRIQASGAIGMRIQQVDDKETIVAVFRGKVDEATKADIAEVRKILGLDPDASEFKVVYGLVATSNKEIAILSRSMLQILIDLASSIDVPAAHVTENRVNPTLKDEAVEGVSVPPLIRINSSPQKPADAFVTVPYRDHWFWIDDRDLQSKGVFSFLMFIFTLTETAAKEAPLVTIPTR